MESIQVTTGSLTTAAQNVDDKAGEYYNDYQAILESVRELTSKDFTGEAANTFKAKVEAFEPDFAKMKQLMSEYATFLREAAKNYEDTELNVISQINGLR